MNRHQILTYLRNSGGLLSLSVIILLSFTNTYAQETITSEALGAYSCYADFEYYFDSSPNMPNHIHFENTSTGPITYCEWDFGDGAQSESFNPEHEYGGAGYYTVCLKVFVLDSLNQIICSDSTCKEIRVLFNIGGHVFAGDFPVDSGYAYLYNYHQLQEPMQEIVFNEFGYYYFYQIPEGDYYIKVVPHESLQIAHNYFPTYLGNEIFWQDAYLINVYESNWELDIHLEEAPGPQSGPCSLSGNVFNLQNYQCVEGVEIILLNENMTAVHYDLSDEEGAFGFNELDYGNWYLQGEICGYLSEPMLISFDENNNEIEDLEIYVDPIVGITKHQINDVFWGSPFPNPADDEIFIDSQSLQSSTVNIQLFDIMGHQISTYKTFLEKGNSSLNIPLPRSCPNGLYVIKLIANDVNESKVFLIHH